MRKTVVIKFRATESQKAGLVERAAAIDTTPSNLLRRAVQHILMGRPADGDWRNDMARVRQTANALLAILSEQNAAHSEGVEEARRLLAMLAQIARRHLEPAA